MTPAFLLLLAAVTAHTNFEGGSVEKFEAVGERHYRAWVKGQADQDGRNRQPSWFYFRLVNVPEGAVVIDLAGLEGEYNYRAHDGSGLRNTRPVYSTDGKTWKVAHNVAFMQGHATLRVRLNVKGGTVWLARQAPYTNGRLDALLKELHGNAHLARERIATTPGGRAMELLTVTDRAAEEAGKRVVWVMARQHAWESGTSWVAEGLLRFLLAENAEAREIRRRCVFRILPMADPDGVARGDVRFNAKGYDLNRNWDTADGERTPEILAQQKSIEAWLAGGRRIDFFLTLHNTESQDYLQGPVTEEARAMVARLTRESSFHDEKSPRAPRTEEPGKGRMTVDEWMRAKHGVAAYLMELMVDRNPKTGRVPVVGDRLKLGEELGRALASGAR